MLLSAAWLTCKNIWCSGEQPTDGDSPISWRYAQPSPLASVAAAAAAAAAADANGTETARKQPPWALPLLRRPAACDTLSTWDATFLQYDNHPCTFLSWPGVGLLPGVGSLPEPRWPPGPERGHTSSSGGSDAVDAEAQGVADTSPLPLSGGHQQSGVAPPGRLQADGGFEDGGLLAMLLGGSV